MRRLTLPLVLGTLVLAGCATVPPPYAPSVSIVNSLSFDHAMSNKRDGLRSAWPMETLSGATEHFPLAQVKQCSGPSLCKWGVLDARRRFGAVRLVPGGVAAEIDVTVHIDRSQQAERKDLSAAMTIPADVAALQSKRTEKREVVLPFGKVVRIDFEHGVRYELCALRLDSARKSVDKCDIDYF